MLINLKVFGYNIGFDVMGDVFCVDFGFDLWFLNGCLIFYGAVSNKE